MLIPFYKSVVVLCFFLIQSTSILAQEFVQFDPDNESPHTQFGWNLFTGFFPQQHQTFRSNHPDGLRILIFFVKGAGR